MQRAEEVIPGHGTAAHIRLEQIETVQGCLGVAGEADQHLNVGLEEAGHQQVSCQSNKLAQGHLSCRKSLI